MGLLGTHDRFSDLGVIEGRELAGGTIVSSPAFLSVASNATIGTVVGTFSVTGGLSPSYTYTLFSDNLGYFSIVGNQLQVNAAMSVGTDVIVVQAAGSLGDVLQQPMSVQITPSGYVPTYYFLGF